MRIHSFQHVPFEGLSMIADWANARGYTLKRTAFHEQDAHIPDLDDYDTLIVMGGPMGVYDGAVYPWLDDEKQHIHTAISAGKKILGVCLGAQLIASVLGASVKAYAEKEIGWYPVTRATNHPVLAGLQIPMAVFHWHGDRFDIPERAVHLMSSEICNNQAFLYENRVLGLQFHLEMDFSAIKRVIQACRHELTEADFIQTADVMLAKAKIYKTKPLLFTLLDNWIRLK